MFIYLIYLFIHLFIHLLNNVLISAGSGSTALRKIGWQLTEITSKLDTE